MFLRHLIFAALLLAATSTTRSDDIALSSMLQRLELKRLETIQKEIDYSKELDENRRKFLARTLLQSYQSQLVDSRHDGLDDLLRKVQNIAIDFPDLVTLRLRLAQEHAKFRKSESQFLNWWNQAAPPQTQPQLKAQFLDIDDSIQAIISSAHQERKQLTTVLPFEPTNSSKDRNRIS